MRPRAKVAKLKAVIVHYTKLDRGVDVDWLCFSCTMMSGAVKHSIWSPIIMIQNVLFPVGKYCCTLRVITTDFGEVLFDFFFHRIMILKSNLVIWSYAEIKTKTIESIYFRQHNIPLGCVKFQELKLWNTIVLASIFNIMDDVCRSYLFMFLRVDERASSSSASSDD